MNTFVKNRLANPALPALRGTCAAGEIAENFHKQSQFYSVTPTKQTISKKRNWVRFWLSPNNGTLPQPSHRVIFQRPMSECSLTTEYRISRPSVSAGRALWQGGCLHADPSLPNKGPISSGSGTRPTWRAASAARVMLFGIRGTMRMRFANSAVLFSFGFSALTANPAQFGQDSGDENYPAPAANTGARHAGEPSCAAGAPRKVSN